MHVKDPNKKE